MDTIRSNKLAMVTGFIFRFLSWRRRRRDAWETLCRGCGLCCYEKEVYRGRLFINTDRPCRFLDTRNNRCKVYRLRFKTCRECTKMTVLRALFVGYLPKRCGYVQKYRIWKNFASYPGYRGLVPEEKLDDQG